MGLGRKAKLNFPLLPGKGNVHSTWVPRNLSLSREPFQVGPWEPSGLNVEPGNDNPGGGAAFEDQVSTGMAQVKCWHLFVCF
jgi:hypothetical protein